MKKELKLKNKMSTKKNKNFLIKWLNFEEKLFEGDEHEEKQEFSNEMIEFWREIVWRWWTWRKAIIF
jgi:hypothetical protein